MGFKDISEEEKKDWIEIKVKIPKNTLALIINSLCIDGCGKIEMGNIRYDKKDIVNNLIGDDE